MVSARNFFDTWIFSVVAMLFMLSILTGIGALVSLLMSRIWGEKRDDAATARMSGTAKELRSVKRRDRMDRKRCQGAFKILAQQLIEGMGGAMPIQNFPGPIVEH